KNEECQVYRVFNDKGMICAGFTEGEKDACQGDSGGPLASLRDDGTAVVIGIVSYGEGCAKPRRPGIYTKVSRLVPWIKRVIREGKRKRTALPRINFEKT
ncbi:CUB and sushi domain-containing protein 1-like protein, partial [Leptotrombidium deliense]